MPWFEMTMTFEAEDSHEAEELMDAVTYTVCGCNNEPTTECLRQVFASLKPVVPDAEDE